MLSSDLVEVVRKRRTSDGATLQLMHQTIKEFIQDPKFKHKILGNSAKITVENGNSFLFKAYFLKGESINGMDIKVVSHYAREAEATTGRSQSEFLSDAPLLHSLT